jgi:hypothetical protein
MWVPAPLVPFFTFWLVLWRLHQACGGKRVETLAAVTPARVHKGEGGGGGRKRLERAAHAIEFTLGLGRLKPKEERACDVYIRACVYYYVKWGRYLLSIPSLCYHLVPKLADNERLCLLN